MTTVKIEVDDQEKAVTILTNAGAEITQIDEKYISVTFKDKEEIGKLNTLLIQNGITVYGIGKERKDLEHLFLDITSKN